MPVPGIPGTPDVDIDAELETTPIAKGEGDSGFVEEGGQQTETLPGPVKVDGELTVPPVIEKKTTPEPTITEGGDGADDKPFRTFKTQEEYDEFVEAQRNKTIVENMQKPAKDPDKPAEPIKFFEDTIDPETGEPKGWKPKDWNNFMNEAANNPAFIQALTDRMSPGIKTTLDNLSAKDEKELDDIDKAYDKEYEALAKSHSLPNLSTDEGKAISKQIFNIGGKYLVPDGGKARVMTTGEMFKMWSSMPEADGGGLEQTTKKAKIAGRRKDSALLTPPRKGQPSTDKKKPTAQHIHDTDMDSLIEEGLEEHAS